MFALLVVLIASRADSAKSADVSAARLDGTSITGELRGWHDGQVVIATAAGEQPLATDQLISLRWPAAPQAATQPAGPPGLVALTDGTLIPMNFLTVVGGRATLTLDRPNDAKHNSLNLPATQLAAVRFQHLDASLATQWDEIRHLNLANDVLAVLKRDGKSLDYVEGVIGDVTAEKVDFKLDGESNRVDRSKVAGVVYYRTDRRTTAEPHVILHGRSGLRAVAAKVQFVTPMVVVSTVGGAKFSWPIEDIELADFSAGKLMYLSDIEPASERWTPLVGLPAGVTLAAEYGRPRRDQSAFGGPLTLVMQDNNSEPASPQSGTRSFNKGLSLRSRTEIVYRLPAGFNRFTATTGIDPATSASGNVRLSILADDRPLLETDIAGNQPPLPIELEITGAKRLKILVDFGQNLDTGDWLNLCDAKIVK